MVKAIDIQCELSCDAEVVRSEGSDTRLSYSKTIIGVIQYKSRMTTALSTHFYGGKKGMKSRIFSIMDMKKKKTGLSILCAVFMLTLGTGAVLAANTDTPNQPEGRRASTGITPWISGSFFPDPAIYGKYADFGITISDDGTQLLYNGQAVRMFADEKSDTEAFYLNDSGSWNLSVNRDAAGKITGVERISEEKAKEYQDTFFAEEYSGSVPKVQDIETVHETVRETVQTSMIRISPLASPILRQMRHCTSKSSV